MRILILHQHFRTPQLGGAIRSYYLAKGFIKAGYTVDVIAGSSHVSSTKVEIIDGIRVHWLAVPYENRFGFLRRIFSFFQFNILAYRFAVRLHDIDLYYAISAPITIGRLAIRLQRRTKVPYVFEVGDLWPDAPIELGFIKNSWLKKLLYKLERDIYQQAKAIIALSPSIQQVIHNRVKNKEVLLITNMADLDFYTPEAKNHELGKQLHVENDFVISYIGALGYANGLEYLLRCAEICLRQNLPIQFLICGTGLDENRLHQECADRKLVNIKLLPFTDRNGVKNILSVTDAIFVSYRPYPILETGSPNKYFDGLAAGKLIIINFGGWIKDEIEKEKCGIAVDTNNYGEFLEKIIPFIYNENLLMAYQHNARQLAEREYGCDRLTERLVRTLNTFER